MTKIFTMHGDKIFSRMPQQAFRKKIFGPRMAKNKVQKHECRAEGTSAFGPYFLP